jgi:cyclophilin family peptidyl-prolyl cis-trans isomerase
MRPFAYALAFAAAVAAGPALAQIVDTPVTGRAPVASPAEKENLLLLDLSTGGRVTVWLRPDVAPKTVERIKTLARRRFYDGLVFHRVIDGFMAQGGDPKGDGTGGSDLPDLPAEFNYLPHVRGAVAAARAEKEDSANSQFYIVFQPRLTLDKKYTVFGRVIDGMQYVDAIERGEPPSNPTRVLHAYVAADNPPAYVNVPTVQTPAVPVTLPGTGPKVAAPKLAKPASKAPARKASAKRK